MAEPRFVRTELGRVFRLADPGDDWLLEIVDGKLVKPVRPITGGALMEAEPLPVAEAYKLLHSPEG